ncbi:hypothetical protein, partial [Tenacibaculum xiamenense]|uniref:hypothetical protein n=1 Tax=Tenacibaculum xiamenense TaxID=1261553 RepID=UPI0038B5BCD8
GVSQQFDLNLPELLKYLDVKLLSDNGHYKLEFKAKGITQLPFGLMLVYLDKNYRLKRQEIYYYTQMNFSDNYKKPEMSNFRLEIVYSKYKTSNFSVGKDVLDLGRYVQMDKEKAVASSRYNGFDIVKM